MNRRFKQGLSHVRALMLFACLWPGLSQGKCELPAIEIPITMSGLRPVAQVGINGTSTPLLLDSGAFFSTLTQAAAAQLQLPLRRVPEGFQMWGLTGAIDVRLTTVRELSALGRVLPNVDFLVGGNEGGEGTMGLLGRNLLHWADSEYDLSKGMLRLIKPTKDCRDLPLAYWAASRPVVEVPLLERRRDALPAIKVRVLINGKSFSAVLDTGALSILSLKAARRSGLLADEKQMVPAGSVRGAGRGEVPSWTVPMASFELGGERVANSRIRVADFDLEDVDMLLGIDYFLSHRIYVARSQERIYFTYEGGPVFDLSRRPSSDAPLAPADETPVDAAAFARRGAALAARRDWERALADFDRASELAPAVGSTFRMRARVHLQLRRLPEAKADLEAALRLDASDHEARLMRATLHAAAKDFPAAHADLDLLDGMLPRQADMRRRVGSLYLDIGMPALAIPQFDRWIADRVGQADLPSALNSRCWARALANVDLQAALADCRAALKANPDSAAFLDSRGMVHLRLGDWAAAQQDYDAALKLNPRAAWSLFGRGLARLRSGESALGATDIAAAKDIRPSIEEEARLYGLAVPAQ